MKSTRGWCSAGTHSIPSHPSPSPCRSSPAGLWRRGGWCRAGGWVGCWCTTGRGSCRRTCTPPSTNWRRVCLAPVPSYKVGVASLLETVLYSLTPTWVVYLGALPRILSVPQSWHDDVVQQIESTALTCYNSLLPAPGLTPIKPQVSLCPIPPFSVPSHSCYVCADRERCTY